ncbi:tubulin alpha chain [Reticulomyxa filosa]|uniref:Tubulin alpha chain n=1 Tax=Reticulomyxa filosa TaxID=46433 RepID=X6LJU9_RETFI|nr:tubulin alpha chain [Reticulomyxa filosa]|eukprot:ETO00995.1 tubulin alpha chain [Reticulomyxa filosa]
MSPIIPKADVSTAPNDVQKIIDDCFKPANWFVKYTELGPAEDKYMAISLNYPGDIKSKEAESTVQLLNSNNKVALVECKRIAQKYDLMMYSQRIFVHWHVGEVMEEELAEAREDLGFLEKDYLDVLIEKPTDDVGCNNAVDDAGDNSIIYKKYFVFFESHVVESCYFDFFLNLIAFFLNRIIFFPQKLS